jgi:hypothetical protein
MKYIGVQVLILICSVLFLYYFATQQYFLPENSDGQLLWSNLVIFLALIGTLLESLVALCVYIGQKVFFYGGIEWPRKRASLKWGFVVSVTLVLVIIMHLLHFIALPWGLMIATIIFIALFLLK